jgi:broad specificity phosphatase PhoE
MRRLLLLRHASTAATRSLSFPADESLDERGRAAATELLGLLAANGEIVSSPAARCLETAGAAGITPSLEPALLECDFGSWTGRTLAELNAAEPDGVAAWMGDPTARPHGGETQAEFAERVARWLDAQATLEGRMLAITHGGVVKAALVHALGAPLEAFWRIDVAPLALTELHAQDGRWTVTRVNASALVRKAEAVYA